MNEKCYAMKDSFFYWVINKNICSVLWINKSLCCCALLQTGTGWMINCRKPKQRNKWWKETVVLATIILESDL